MTGYEQGSRTVDVRFMFPDGEQFLVLRPESRQKEDFGLTSGTSWMNKPMRCATFLELFRGLLVLCGMPVQLAAARTYNALRRCIPTAQMPRCPGPR